MQHLCLMVIQQNQQARLRNTTLLEADILCNKANETKLINKVKEHLQSADILLIFADDDADIFIVRNTWSSEDSGHNVVAAGGDTDLLVLVSLSKSCTSIFFLEPGKAHNPSRTYDISNLQANTEHLCQHLLFLHAVTGCDTSSAIHWRGKTGQ